MIVWQTSFLVIHSVTGRLSLHISRPGRGSDVKIATNCVMLCNILSIMLGI